MFVLILIPLLPISYSYCRNLLDTEPCNTMGHLEQLHTPDWRKVLALVDLRKIIQYWPETSFSQNVFDQTSPQEFL